MAPVRVLLAEDDAAVAEEFCTAARTLGYDAVFVADTGEAAIRGATACRPDVVFMDIRLPGDTGAAEAADWLRTNRGLPVVFLIASPHDESLYPTAAARPWGYLLRPFNHRELRTLVESAVRCRALERELRETSRRLDALQAEARDSAAMAELSAIYDHAPCCILVLDAERRLRKFNRTAADFLGEPPAVLAGRRFGEALRCVNASNDSGGCGFGERCPRCAVRRAVCEAISADATCARLRTEMTRSGKDRDKTLHLAISAVPIPTVGEKMALMFIEDLTRMERIENALRQSEARYSELVEMAGSLILRMDPAGRVTFLNDFAARFFGFEREEIVGRSVLGTIVPEAETTGRSLAEVLADICRRPERYRVHEQENIRRDGRRVWVAWSNRAVRDQDGNLVEILCVGHDITQLKEMEAELRQMQKMEAIGHLAGGIAHDFNNLLTGILGNAEVLLAGLSDGSSRSAVEAIIRAAHRGAELTRRLLDFARKRPRAAEPVDLNVLATEVIQLLRRTSDRRIEMELWQHSGSAIVLGDPGQLEQVVLNLAMNAVDAMPRGGRLTMETYVLQLDAAECAAHPELKPGEYVVLVVADTGCGIPKEIQPRIFEPFFTTKKPGRGTGMGLAMANAIVRDHGGCITFHSEPGRGSVFRVYLPLGAGEGPPKEEAQPRPMPTESREIMVVDDDPTVLGVTARMLDRLGYVARTFAEAREAIEYYRTHASQVALVIIDMDMPEMSGHACFEEMRATNPDLRAVLATGHGLDDDAQRLLLGEMRGVLQKPYTLDELARVVSEALRRRATGEGRREI